MKIAYKITNAVAVLGIFPALLLLPVFRFIAVVNTSTGGGSNPLMGLLGGLVGGILDINSIIEKITGINIEKLPEFYTVSDLYEMFAGEQAQAFAGYNTDVIPEQMKNFLIIAAVLLALAIVFALVTMISGFFVKKITVPVVTSALALGSAFGAKFFFTNIAEQLISGKIAVTSLLLGVPDLTKYEKYISYIDFDIRILELSHAFTAFLILLAVILILNIGFRIALSLKDA